MIATTTGAEFNRFPSKALSRVDRGQTVLVEKNGEPRAAVIPQPLPTSGVELAKRLARSQPQPKTAAAVAAIIKGMDEAK